jgi:hypothetical protein
MARIEEPSDRLSPRGRELLRYIASTRTRSRNRNRAAREASSASAGRSSICASSASNAPASATTPTSAGHTRPIAAGSMSTWTSLRPSIIRRSQNIVSRWLSPEPITSNNSSSGSSTASIAWRVPA